MAQNNEQEFTDFEVAIDLTATQAWDGTSAPPLPIDDYKVKVANVKSTTSGEKQTPMIAVTFEVLEGPEAGNKAYNNYNIGNETGLKRLKSLMVACGTRLDKFVASELLGAELMIHVDHEIVAGKVDENGNVGKERTYGRVSMERPIEQPKAAATTATRPPVTNKAPAANGQTRRA